MSKIFLVILQGINFDPKDPRKKEVLKRWYSAVKPLLKSYSTKNSLKLNKEEINHLIRYPDD